MAGLPFWYFRRRFLVPAGSCFGSHPSVLSALRSCDNGVLLPSGDVFSKQRHAAHSRFPIEIGRRHLWLWTPPGLLLRNQSRPERAHDLHAFVAGQLRPVLSADAMRCPRGHFLGCGERL